VPIRDLPPGLSVLVPVYQSETSLTLLIQRLEDVLQPLDKPFEVVLVNDGSTDGSWRAITQLAKQHPVVRGINLMRNYGQHNALLCGIRAARFDTIVTIDDDLQNPPEELPRMLEALDSGFDVIYGTPDQGQHGLWRNCASWTTKRALQGVMGAETARHASAFRAFRTHLRRAFDSFASPAVSIDVLLSWATPRFSYITVRFDPRKFGESNYTLRRLINHAFDMMTGFSTLPLTLASYIGFFFAVIGLILLVFVIVAYFVHGTAVQGFSFLASVVVIFSGAQLFALGMIGQYLARMHWRSMDRPPFTIADTTDG
jgi:glycosyltransferase involved in cell wall biosynthesis